MSTSSSAWRPDPLHSLCKPLCLSRSGVETCPALLNGPLFNLQAYRSGVNCTWGRFPQTKALCLQAPGHHLPVSSGREGGVHDRMNIILRLAHKQIGRVFILLRHFYSQNCCLGWHKASIYFVCQISSDEYKKKWTMFGLGQGGRLASQLLQNRSSQTKINWSKQFDLRGLNQNRKGEDADSEFI